jgi:hypothetical protein
MRGAGGGEGGTCERRVEERGRAKEDWAGVWAPQEKGNRQPSHSGRERRHKCSDGFPPLASVLGHAL